MSVGTIRPSGVGAPLPPVMPLRIRNKGPEYFRRPAGGAGGKPSAVERLEADKLKYVKSKQVASTKQEPVRPALSKQPLFSPGVQRVLLTPNRRMPPAALRLSSPNNSLNLDVLTKLINLCDSPLKSPRGEVAPWQAKKEPPNPSSTPNSPRTPSTAAVRRVDVKPREALPPAPGTPLSPSSPLCSPSDSGKRRSQLQRSKSDLSDRFSRVSANLERFFNYCGLDPGEVGNIGAEHFACASSDIAKFHSVSSSGSECAQSQFSETAGEETPAARLPYGISVIERNARVIKWLYGLKQTIESQKLPPTPGKERPVLP
ncbi:hypothetical protein XENTR_v10003357 [Xenopus tropicalis]|uniref:Protein FAM110A n=1 Tax=Xenopus tropicalis TaxID=8364 RepID=A0A8J1IY00_XENTR|nr:protein FAM110A [Xenopus tropicalis]XP_031750443.1 protein FAM110A [Xenopus tropicalis]KAE8574265.1 hypothetical protein XENTR_v10003357 [Xenopus tropicalis]KAE8574266.1 hypothetical protein XENTR_v10003357 [Xenopus tropicalis]